MLQLPALHDGNGMSKQLALLCKLYKASGREEVATACKIETCKLTSSSYTDVPRCRINDQSPVSGPLPHACDKHNGLPPPLSCLSLTNLPVDLLSVTGNANLPHQLLQLLPLILPLTVL